jgi:hypothetical protein
VAVRNPPLYAQAQTEKRERDGGTGTQACVHA